MKSKTKLLPSKLLILNNHFKFKKHFYLQGIIQTVNPNHYSISFCRKQSSKASRQSVLGDDSI